MNHALDNFLNYFVKDCVKNEFMLYHWVHSYESRLFPRLDFVSCFMRLSVTGMVELVYLLVWLLLWYHKFTLICLEPNINIFLFFFFHSAIFAGLNCLELGKVEEDHFPKTLEEFGYQFNKGFHRLEFLQRQYLLT